MQPTYWRLKLFQHLSADTKKATLSAIVLLLVCLLFVFGHYFDGGAPLAVLSFLCAPLAEMYLVIKTLKAFSARRIRATAIYVLTLSVVLSVLGVTGVFNGQARSFAANIFILKNQKELEGRIQLAQKNSSFKNENVEIAIKRYRFSDDVLIYDESQELLKPMPTRSPVWRSKHMSSEFDCPHSVERVRDNFFLVHFAC
jgi:ABC-type multidrug transport system fused ATPase/permease subunit